MKRILTVFIFTVGLFMALSNPSISKAATAGPVDMQQLTATQGTNPGQVTLWWKQVAGDVTAYHVVYGTKPLTYEFSALNIPSAGVGVQQSFTISSLVP